MREEFKELSWYLVTCAIVFVLIGMFMSGCASDGICNLDRPDVEGQVAPIVRGEPAVDSRSVLRLELASPRGLWGCTATAIGEYTVLTAAHCIKDAKALRVFQEGVFVGEATDWLVHPDFDKSKGIVMSKRNKGDLALVFMDEPIPAPIATVAELPEGCYPGLLAVGYGVDENGELGGLRQRVIYEKYHNKRSIFVTEGTCYGDSGGGLYASTPDGETVIGVASFVRSKDCTSGLPARGDAGFTNLLTYKPWIEERLR